MILYSLTTFGALSLGAIAATAQTFDFTGAIETWTVPTTGLYEITAFGAQGGGNGIPATLDPFAVFGGLGAEIGGSFTLTQGQVIDIVVGGKGGDGAAGGGGGGSFVYTSGNSPLVVAGGGGGSGYSGRPYPQDIVQYANGGPGQTGTSGQAGINSTGFQNYSDGGINGSGGNGGEISSGGGGGGWISNGGDGKYAGNGNTGSGSGGFGAFNFAGGHGKYTGSGTIDPSTGNPYDNRGGFGGGGGGGYDDGGGGGGYSGGGGGYGGDGDPTGGGGGGSFLDDSALDPLLIGGENSGDGEIIINFLPVPDNSATATLLIASTVGLLLWKRRETAV